MQILIQQSHIILYTFKIENTLLSSMYSFMIVGLNHISIEVLSIRSDHMF